MARQFIVTFMGSVGVGKSTQIRLMYGYLRSKGMKTATIFIKSNHGLAYTLRIFLNSININKNALKNLFPLLYALDIISIVIKFFFAVYIPFRMGFSILIEEGPLMTLFTYTRVNPNLMMLKQKVPVFVPRLVGWIQQNRHVNIILDAEDKELVKRRKRRRYRQYESSRFVNLQKDWFKQLNYGNTIFLNTTKKPVMEVHKNILTCLEKYLQ